MYYPLWMQGLYCNPKTNQWRQHPKDYLEVLEFIVRDALDKCLETGGPLIGMAGVVIGAVVSFLTAL